MLIYVSNAVPLPFFCFLSSSSSFPGMQRQEGGEDECEERQRNVEHRRRQTETSSEAAPLRLRRHTLRRGVLDASPGSPGFAVCAHCGLRRLWMVRSGGHVRRETAEGLGPYCLPLQPVCACRRAMRGSEEYLSIIRCIRKNRFVHV